MSETSEFINDIIENALATAQENTQAAEDAANDLIAANAGVYITPPDSLAGWTPEAVEPEVPAVNDSISVYDAKLAELVALLSGQLANFFATYYPLANDAFDEGTAWLIDVITNGGTGVNTSVEDQIWQRDRDRRLSEAGRAKAQIVTGFGAKGWTLAPGAMVKKMAEADFMAASDNGVASTSVAAKQLEIEIATVRSAVEEAMKARFSAMNAAADYIRAIASAPASAVGAASIDTDARAKMLSATASFYGTRLERDRIVLSGKLAEMNSRDDIYKHRRDVATRNSQVDVQALTAAADAFARTAAAALSSLNSIVSTGVNAFA